jgi:hypothetical protein
MVFIVVKIWYLIDTIYELLSAKNDKNIILES